MAVPQSCQYVVPPPVKGLMVVGLGSRDLPSPDNPDNDHGRVRGRENDVKPAKSEVSHDEA